MNRARIIHVVGARPNFMKVAPLVKEMAQYPEEFEQVLVHTGQHYDANMSQVFFRDLELPEPDIYLEVGSGTHAEQTARVMMAFDPVLLAQRPDLVVVVGDVNSTLACALTAAKRHVPIAHVEAGLRAFDRRMPEEINRVLTDALSSYLFTTSRNANDNLQREGISEERIFFVGNVMIDTLLQHRQKATGRRTWVRYGLRSGRYALLTLHRPSNVDDRDTFAGILNALAEIERHLSLVFVVHPRTAKRICEFGFDTRLDEMNDVIQMEPLGYLDFLSLMSGARMVLTDSGGIQEESTVLEIPCLTLRENTERPVTISEGTNVLVGTEPERIVTEAMALLEDRGKQCRMPELWDGEAARRIVGILRSECEIT